MSQDQSNIRALKDNEQARAILSAIMEHSVDLVFAKDMDFKYICCSPAFVKFTQTEADVIGKDDYDFWTKEEADHFRSDDVLLFESGTPLIDYVEPIPSDDGIQHYCSTSKYLLRDASDNVIGMYGIGRDVTEYQTAYDQLQLLTNNISGGIITYMLTPTGIRISYFNDGLCEMLGYTREEYQEMTKDNVITAVFEEDVPRLQAQIVEIMEKGTPVNCTYRVHNMKTGGFKWVNLRVEPPEDKNGTLYANAVLYDVTEQKLAAEAAAIHEKKLEYAFSQIGKMVSEYDVATKTLTLPEGYARQHGLPRIICNVPYCFENSNKIGAGLYSAYREFYEAVLRGEKTGAVEVQKIDKSGAARWERMEFATIFDDEGNPVKAMIAADDTTEQHRKFELEQNRPKLGEKNLLVHALFNVTTGKTLEYAYRDGSEVPIDDRTAFVYSSSDAVDRCFVDAHDRESYRLFNDPHALLARYEDGETETVFEYRRKLPSGEILWVRNILRMMRDPISDDILLFDYFYNIEEEKLQELMYSALVNDNYDYVAYVNGRSRHYNIITNIGVQYNMPPQQGDDFNSAMEAVIKQYVHPDDREMVLANIDLENIKKILAKADRHQFMYRLVCPDDEVCYKKVTEYYLDREMEIIIITGEDVTQIMREEAEKSAMLADALVAANQASQAKSVFLSRMSHELRTPMNAIIGLSALSATELDDPQMMENNISKISLSARYLLSLINDILDMSRIESGYMVLTEEPFDFEELISNVNTIIYGQASAKGLDYDVIVEGYTEPTYVGDATKLQEILVNVLNNAVKFTSVGKITLAIEQRHRVKNHATLRFTVTDTGIGIDESFLPKLFEPFAQESESFTSTSVGTGLGLAITKSLVEMMNGQVLVKSIKDVGSVFTIDVQLDILEESQQYLNMVASLKLNEISALVVDDDVTVCKSTENILKAMGMQAQWVDCGCAAVECVKTAHTNGQDFDAIFIDWRMPDMDGIETTRQIRTIVGPDVTIIIMTAYDWHPIEAEARQAGVDLFMEKPLLQSSILRTLEKAFLPGELPTPEEPTLPDFTGRRILLAEDRLLNVEVARRLLEKVGAEVIVAHNGLEALEAFTTAKDGYFDAILMDIRMPEMDGLAATANIRKLKKAHSRDIPIVAMTANAFDEDVELSLRSGMNAHLTKPIDPKTLFATLDRLMQ